MSYALTYDANGSTGTFEDPSPYAIEATVTVLGYTTNICA